MKKATRMTSKFAFALTLLITGLVLNNVGLGAGNFGAFDSVGTYLIYVGFIGLLLVGLAAAWVKDKLVDERMQFVATKAIKLTFVFFVAVAFLIMIIDGIEPITMPYHLFMSYFVSGILAFYFVSYRLMLRRY